MGEKSRDFKLSKEEAGFRVEQKDKVVRYIQILCRYCGSTHVKDVFLNMGSGFQQHFLDCNDCKESQFLGIEISLVGYGRIGEERMMDNLFKSLAPHGTFRTAEDASLLMVPEAGVISRKDWLEMREQGRLVEVWRMCGNCRVLMKIEHTQNYSLKSIQRCPCCRSNDWQPTDARRGVTDGRLSAPRVPLP